MADWIDLALLQSKAKTHFVGWDKSASEADTKAASNARRQIKHLAIAVIDQLSGIDEPGGLYTFVHQNVSEGQAHNIYYVGLVKHQSLATRMRNYLTEELSVLDPSLLPLTESEASEIIRKRLSIAMPQTTKLDRYTKNHMKSREMSTADSIFLCPVKGSADLIEAAETVLIATARDCGHKLVNQKK
jgi:hypothetical protein